MAQLALLEDWKRPMGKKRNGSTSKPVIDLPDKRTFWVSEVARAAAAVTGETEAAAQCRLYRRIDSGSIQTVRILGKIAITRDEALKALNGEAGR